MIISFCHRASDWRTEWQTDRQKVYSNSAI